jgi:hypothetical protein
MSVKRDLDTTEAEDNNKMIVDKTEGGMTQADDKEKMMVDKTEDLEVEETKGHKTEAKRKEVAKNMEVEGTKIAEGDKTEDMEVEETKGNKTVLTESDTQKLKSFTIAGSSRSKLSESELQKRSEAFDNNRSFDAKRTFATAHAKGTKDSLLFGLNIDSQVSVSKRKQDKQDKAMGWGDGHADKGAPDMDNADKGAPPSKGMWQGGGYVGKGKGDADTAGGANMADMANMANTADEANMTQRLDNHAEACRNMNMRLWRSKGGGDGPREHMLGETPESNMADIAYMANTAAALMTDIADMAKPRLDEADNTGKFGPRGHMFGETPEPTESGDSADKAKYDSWTTDKYCPHCHKEVTIAIDTMGMAWFDKSSHERQAEETQTEEVEETQGDTTEAKRKEVAKNMQVEGANVAEGDKTEDMEVEETKGDKSSGDNTGTAADTAADTAE